MSIQYLYTFSERYEQEDEWGHHKVRVEWKLAFSWIRMGRIFGKLLYVSHRNIRYLAKWFYNTVRLVDGTFRLDLPIVLLPQN